MEMKDSILLSYHIHAVATPLTSAHLSCWEEETGHGFSTLLSKWAVRGPD